MVKRRWNQLFYANILKKNSFILECMYFVVVFFEDLINKCANFKKTKKDVLIN